MGRDLKAVGREAIMARSKRAPRARARRRRRSPPGAVTPPGTSPPDTEGRAARRSARAAAEATPDTLTVVYIHGIGNKPAPATLKRQWDQALFRIDMGARTRLAYWADLRYPQPLPSSDVEGLAVLSPDAYHPLRQTERPPFDEYVERLAPYGQAAHDWARRAARAMLTRPAPAGPRARDVEAKILPGLIRRPVVEWITKTFIEDTAAYFFDPEQRDQMRLRFRTVLQSLPGPFVVVAHSQGSIIAYDVLREFDETPPPLEVRLFVTIGSPLGLEEVQDNLIKPLRVPRVVRAWANFADPVDPVAADKTLRGDFRGEVRIDDVGVVNRDTLRLAGFNPHSGTGYLATDEVRSMVQRVVGSTFASPVAPFVIARDVATDMADPTQRISVLIELKDSVEGRTLTERRDAVQRELLTMEAAFKAALAESDREVDYYEIDLLQRFVGANLTPAEIDEFAARHAKLGTITTVWRNSPKRALVDRSAAVVQATTAQLGYNARGQRIHWAVLDTGVNPGHPHFRRRATIVDQVDCTRPGPPRRGPLTDADGHGTHVAGIIAGESAPAVGRRGMAPEAKLHVYKVLDDNGNGRDSWIIKALDHISEVNESSDELVIHGVNLSLGGPFDEAVFACGFSPICRELRRLWRRGVVVCIAAGNEGRLIIDTADGEQKLNLDLSIGDPANLDEAVAVGSVHREFPHLYGISWFSSRGPTADGRSKPDVVAPGERIMSCNAHFQRGVADSEYVAMSGTSMACPHVSGLIAAFLSVRREFIGSPERVKEILAQHCTDLRRDRYHQGAGLPNLVKMLMNT
jgi:subtilisin family serine protease